MVFVCWRMYELILNLDRLLAIDFELDIGNMIKLTD